jgi:5-methylcytosine-specific restriction endonuclease McrA
MRIQEYLNTREKYAVNQIYQREDNVWSSEDKQCLIDTILRKEPMPAFFLNLVDEIHYIVDGQQRLSCIEQFFKNEIRLNAKFSGQENAGKTFNGSNSIGEADKETFLNYDLTFNTVRDYDDLRVRMLFSRLQRGKPLTLGERLNAMPGLIVNCMRELAEHPFMSKSIAVSKTRHGLLPDVARLLLYARYGAKNSGTGLLCRFVEQNSAFDTKCPEFKETRSTLDHLERCFPSDPGNYHHLEKHTWVLAVFTMIHELRKKYSLHDAHLSIGNFIRKFHSFVYNEDIRDSDNKHYQRFYDRIRGGWSERLIADRRDILINEFLSQHTSLPELSVNRQISDAEKISLFAKHPICQRCGAEFKDYKSPEYHHVNHYADGGATHVDNIMVLCKDCHNKEHSND